MIQKKCAVTATIAAFAFPLIALTQANDAVRAGELEVVVPDWHLPMGICHAVFPSRRGLLPAVRVFIDFLAERMPGVIEANRLKCKDCKPKA